jgi:ATP-binding cassette subfamily B protein RaxB
MGFVFLKQHFVASISALIPKVSEIKLIKLELERVSDIVLHQADAPKSENPILPYQPQGAYSIENLTYTYSAAEQPVLEKISFSVAAKSCFIITGKSGSGKSTLLKLLLGQLVPSDGAIRLDTRPLYRIDQQKAVAAVLHSDGLLAGSLAYNITLDLDINNVERLKQACSQAGIYDELSQMPMGLNTLVGELGCSLSAGQIQRVLIARALYRLPSILILDEALSHLDQDMARVLLARLKATPLTIIMVTHNTDLLDLGDGFHHLTLPTRERK